MGHFGHGVGGISGVVVLSGGGPFSVPGPQATAALWEYTDDRLRRVAQEATEIRGSDRSRELWR